MRHSMVYARKLIKMAKIRSRTHGSCRRPGLSWTQRSISREATMAVLEHHADLPLRPDYTLDQPRHLYSAEDHAVWRDLFRRQAAILPGRACDEFLAGPDGLGVAADYEKGGGIPDFERLSDILDATTGWRIVAVPGLESGRGACRGRGGQDG